MATVTYEAPRNFATDEYGNYLPQLERQPLDWRFIFESDIPPGPRILYSYIVSRIPRGREDEGLAIPMETLGRVLNISYATVHKHIQRLQTLGFLRIEQNAAGHNRYYPIHYFQIT